MQTNIKSAMSFALKQYLKEIQTKLIAKDERKDKKRKYSREDIAKIEQLLREIGWEAAKTEKQMQAFAILFDAPELKQGSIIPLEQHCVVVLEASVHGMAMNRPYILTYLKERSTLIEDGRTAAYTFNAADKPRLATLDEVASCVDALSAKQWASIMNENEACLKGIRDCVMNCQVEFNEEPGEENAGNEVELANGRVITMNDE